MSMLVEKLENFTQPRVKCLLVDDLEENLLALSALLRRDDVELLTAQSGAEALELLLLHDVALALLDVHMPGMDGFELAELMRGSERTRQVPIIFLTAGVRDQHRQFKGYEAGAVDFLYKPVEAHILKNKAEVFFQLYRQKHQLAQQLQERTQTLRLNEMFMAVLSHDLRNPLAAIMFCSELIDGKSTDAAVKKSAAQIMTSGKRMSGMIADMLDLARARLGGGIAINRAAVDLGAVIERVLHEYQAAFPQRVIQVSRQGDLNGQWDGERLAQVASNLIGNAIHHGTDGVPIRVVMDGTRADSVEFSVANAGSISADVLPHIFEPFRGDHEQRSHTTKGLGLGLYIVSQIVQAHGGRIDLDSDAQATTFSVSVPRAADAVDSSSQALT